MEPAESEQAMDAPTEQILRDLYEQHPFLSFLFKTIPPLTDASMRGTMHRMFLGGCVCVTLVLLIVVMTAYSVVTFEEDPSKTFVENVGYLYYYIMVVAYSVPTVYAFIAMLNVSWLYFKFN